MITGAEPDVYRDYYLDKTLPDLANQLKKAVQILQDEVDRLIEVVGKRGEETSYMEDVIYDLTSIAENVDSLTYNSRLSDLKNIISGLAEKMIELEEQALDLFLFGHTHRPLVDMRGRTLFLNPGSIGDYAHPFYGVVTIENGRLDGRTVPLD